MEVNLGFLLFPSVLCPKVQEMKAVPRDICCGLSSVYLAAEIPSFPSGLHWSAHASDPTFFVPNLGLLPVSLSWVLPCCLQAPEVILVLTYHAGL